MMDCLQKLLGKGTGVSHYKGSLVVLEGTVGGIDFEVQCIVLYFHIALYCTDIVLNCIVL